MICARFSPKAERDLDGHCGYIAADNPEAAKRVRQIILHTAIFSPNIRSLGVASASPPHVTRKSAGSWCQNSQLPDLLPTVSGNGDGRARAARGAGLDAVLSGFAKPVLVSFLQPRPAERTCGQFSDPGKEKPAHFIAGGYTDEEKLTPPSDPLCAGSAASLRHAPRSA